MAFVSPCHQEDTFTRNLLHTCILAVSIAAGALLVTACTPEEAKPTSLADARARVEGGLRVAKPAGAGTFPTILYFHGASDQSWYAAQQDILDKFVAEGFAAVFVDMYHGRGVNGQSLRSGGLVPRATAGDVMIAVDWAGKQSLAAPGKLGVFGISFGAATIMDALVLDAPGRLPTSLLEKPAAGMAPVKAAAMLSPWCAADVMGFNLIKAVHENFSRQVPMLMVLPDGDTVSDTAICKDIASRNQALGGAIEVVDVPGAGHAFAQPVDDYGNAFPDYNADKAKDAWARIMAFFKAKLG
jgi:dienelactone hydrolase